MDNDTSKHRVGYVGYTKISLLFLHYAVLLECIIPTIETSNKLK